VISTRAPIASRFARVPRSSSVTCALPVAWSLRRKRTRGPVRFVRKTSWSPSPSQSTSAVPRASSGKPKPDADDTFAKLRPARLRNAQFSSRPDHE
jgi:hypothetical protein